MSLPSAVAGAAMITLNEAIFISAQVSLKNNHKAFDPAPGTAHDSTSSAVALELYRQQFIELAAVMKLYHSLVARDIDIIQKAHDNITETDAALSAGMGR